MTEKNLGNETPPPSRANHASRQALLHAPECLFHNTHQIGDCDCDIATLTLREREVLDFTSDGLIAREIAALMGVSTKCVGNYRTAINHKLGDGFTQKIVQGSGA